MEKVLCLCTSSTSRPSRHPNGRYMEIVLCLCTTIAFSKAPRYCPLARGPSASEYPSHGSNFPQRSWCQSGLPQSPEFTTYWPCVRANNSLGSVASSRDGPTCTAVAWAAQPGPRIFKFDAAACQYTRSPACKKSMLGLCTVPIVSRPSDNAGGCGAAGGWPPQPHLVPGSII